MSQHTAAQWLARRLEDIHRENKMKKLKQAELLNEVKSEEALKEELGQERNQGSEYLNPNKTDEKE